jgi:hypothetical protein
MTIEIAAVRKYIYIYTHYKNKESTRITLKLIVK